MTDPEHEERLSNSGSFGTDSQQTFDTAAGVVSVRSSTSTSTQVPTVPVTETSSYHTATRPMSSATEELQTGGEHASTGAITMPTTQDPSTTAPPPQTQAKEASAVNAVGGGVSGVEGLRGNAMGEPNAAAEQSAPPGEIGLDVLLVSGKRQRFLFAPDVTVGEVKSRIHKDWPQDWQSEYPRSKSSLRILYLGKFLADSTTLESNNFRKGETTVVHILIRQEESRADALAKGKSNSTCGCCTIV